MPYIAGIGHRVGLRDLLDKFAFEDLDDAETSLEEAGLSVFSNESQDAFITVANKYRMIDNDYEDLDFQLSQDEFRLLETYTGMKDKRIKLFWVDPEEDDNDQIQLLNNPSILQSILSRVHLKDEDEDEDEDEDNKDDNST